MAALAFAAAGCMINPPEIAGALLGMPGHASGGPGGGFGQIPQGPRGLGGAPVAPEDPLEATAAVKDLQPAPPAPESVRFWNGSRYYTWVDASGDRVMIAEIGGAARLLTPYNRSSSFDPRWTADGSKLLIIDYAKRPSGGTMPASGYRARIFPLAGGEPLLVGEGDIPPPYGVLPDGSGITRAQGTGLGSPSSPFTPTPSPVTAAAIWRLFLRLPGEPEKVVAELPNTREGIWSWDAQEYAYVGFRDGDPLKGMDLSKWDRRTGETKTLYHLETDYFWPAQEDNFRWAVERRICFAQRVAFGATASITVASIPADGSPAEITFFPVPLSSGETLGPLLMSPDGRSVAFTKERTVQIKGPDWSAGVQQSQGIEVATWESGKIRKLTTRGRPIAWFPDSRQLVASTGSGGSRRFYVIDTAPISEDSP